MKDWLIAIGTILVLGLADSAAELIVKVISWVVG